jgi:type III secretion system YscD/HrpQ family protein
VRLLRGLHQGATVDIPEDGRLTVGSDVCCAVVLCDKDVAAMHCQIIVDEIGVSCRALQAAITVDGKRVGSGEIVDVAQGQLVACGTAAFVIGEAASDWSAVERELAAQGSRRGALISLRNANPYVLFASVLIGITGLLSLAYAAISDVSASRMPTKVEAARRWLAQIAPHGSELHIGIDQRNGEQLLLSGYVPANELRVKLTNEVARSSFRPRLEVFTIDEMLTEMSRLADRAGIPCEPQYRSEGQLACARTVTSDEQAARLRTFARDVPGLRSLDIRVVASPAPVVAAAPTPRVSQITQRFAVLMFRNQRFLVNEHGKRFTEGDEFDGLRIERIEIDRVIFARDGRSYEFYVAALGKRQ